MRSCGLGVRDADVVAGPGGVIPPDDPAGHPQGTSVVTGNPCSLPAFTRPNGGGWNGTGGANVAVFTMDSADLEVGNNLFYQAAPTVPNPNHGVISAQAAANLTLDEMRNAVAATVNEWAIVAAPPAPCP